MNKVVKNKLFKGLCLGCTLLSIGAVALFEKRSEEGKFSAFASQTIAGEYALRYDLEIPKKSFTVGDDSYDATTILYFPSGNAVSGEKVKLTEVGKYTLVYRATVEGEIYEEKHEFLVKNGLFGMSNEAGSASYGSHAYVPDTEGIVVKLTNGSAFRYNKILDVSKLTKEDTFFKFYILPAKLGTAEVNKINVTLTDVYDSNNFVTFTAKGNVGNDANLINTVNSSAQMPTGLEQGSDNGKYPMVTYEGSTYRLHANSSFGTYIGGNASMTGEPRYGSIATNFVDFKFDYEQKTAYNQHSIIADLDEVSMFSAPWKGFTTGEVYLSVEGMQFFGTEATIMISDIMDEDLTVAELEDVNPPQIAVDTGAYAENELPYGIVGEKYPLFPVSASDKESDSVKTSVRVFYNYGSENQVEERVDNLCFTPARAGNYTVEYKATDPSGLQAVKLLKIVVFDEKSKLKIALDDAYTQSGSFGKAAKVKGYTLSDCSGTPTISAYALCLASNKKYPVDMETLTFVPLEVGDYKIVYEYGDYVFSEEVSYPLTVQANEGAYLDVADVVLPKYLVKGGQYSFPAAHGYSYNQNKTVDEKVYLMVYDDGKATGTLYENTDWVTITANESTTVRYFTVNSAKVTDVEGIDFNSDYVAYQDFTIPTINGGFNTDTLDLSKYFYTDGTFTAQASAENIQFVSTAAATQRGSAVIEFVNSVYLQGSGVSFAFTDGFTPFSVNYYDGVTGERVLKISYALSGANLIIDVNGKETYTVSNQGLDFPFAMNVGQMEMQVYKNISVKLTQTYAGNSIKEALDDKLYLALEFEQVREPLSLTLRELCNQPMNNVTFDQISPIISSMDSLGDYKINDVHTFKPMFAYDVINPNVEFTLKVTMPDGSVAKAVDGTLLNNVDPSKTYQLLLNKFGSYRIVYTVNDNGQGVPVSLRRMLVVVDDEPPVITLKNAKTEGRVGEEIKVADHTVTDNYTTDLSVSVYVIYPQMKVEQVTDGKFTATMAGDYYVYYMVMDEEGNIAFNDYKVTVR